MIGYTAGSERLDSFTAVLFALLFLWQMPHFLAIAWLNRDDYAAGGFCMLTLCDVSGHSTGMKSAIYALLLPVCALPYLWGLIGWPTAGVCLVTTATHAGTAISMAHHPSPCTTQTLLFASLACLPITHLALVRDKALA